MFIQSRMLGSESHGIRTLGAVSGALTFNREHYALAYTFMSG